MNQAQPYMDMHSGPHMSSAQPYASQPATSGGLSHYSQYQQPQVMQPSSNHYAPGPSYGAYGYNGVTSPQSATHPSGPIGASQMPAHGLQLPAMMPGSAGQHGYMGAQNGPGPTYTNQHQHDTTGQVAPPGMKPRVTATLWEDEGSLCFQVEAKGVCVARREDNHFINGTKLLNVAGMTRGRRDGILKSEKVRHVVKIGPMHLKGVWIPFERALDFANKEKITEQLYPLFVHNIGGLLYHPTNENRTNSVVNATERRQQSGAPPSRNGQPQPALTHHHSMSGTIGSGAQPPTPHSIAPHPGTGRPGIDRAHTFPTPPTSASSVNMSMGYQGGSGEWGSQNLGGNVPNGQDLSINTSGMSNTRSMPTTPASTPPGQQMPSYQGQQGYENPKQYYSGPPSSQSSYAPQPNLAQSQMSRYSAPGYKNEMGPPSAPGAVVSTDADGHEIKSDHYPQDGSAGHVGHADQSNEHTHDSTYMASSGSYPSRGYSYGHGTNVGAIQTEHPHLSPEITGSPHQPGSGRGTPRTAGSQGQWQQQGYQTPPRNTSSNLYNVMSDSRGQPAAQGVDTYASSGYSGSSMNGPSQSLKRGRDDEESMDRPSSRDVDPNFDLKRRKTNPMGAPMGAMPMGQAIKTGGGMPRQR